MNFSITTVLWSSFELCGNAMRNTVNQLIIIVIECTMLINALNPYLSVDASDGCHHLES